MRKAFYIISATLIATILRLTPTLISGLPFSTDAWSPIRNAELLMKYTPIPISDNKIFDGYNNYWPANSIFGIIFSYTTGLKIIDAMAISIPLAGALTIPIFYTLTKKITKNSKIAFISSILLATAYPYTLFTAGVTKETYANPLYILTLLIFLNYKKWKDILPFTITSLALAMSHHLTTVITIVILTNITLATEIFRIKKGLEPDKNKILLTLTLLTITILYFDLYAQNGLRITITSSDILSLTSYQIITFTLALYLTFKNRQHSTKRTILTSTLTTTLVLSIIILTTERSIIPGAPQLPKHYILYASPFIITTPLITLGLTQNTKNEKHIIPLFWLTTLLGLESYATFGNPPIGLALAYRTINFLLPPLIIISTLGAYKLLTNNTQKITKPITYLIIILLITLNSYNLYASTTLQERYLGYFWLYNQPEYMASKWITTTNQTITADVKISYLLNYFNIHTDPTLGLQYLIENKNIKHITLITYQQMLKNGYVLYGGYSIDLPKNWTEKINTLNLIYSNNQVKIYNR